MQIAIPRSKSLWPSMPRNVTWDKSGSFRLASPPASSARADAALRSVSTAAAAPNLMNLSPRDHALASHTLIHFPPSLIRSTRKYFPAESLPAHLFDRALLGANSGQFVHIPSGRCRHAPPTRLPQNSPMQHPLHGRAGWHKSQIYNILRMAGQTLSTYKKTSPVSSRIRW